MINNKLKQFIKKSFLYPKHIGNYIRELYFWDFVKKLPEEKIKKILDAGCGSGNYTYKTAKMLPNSQVDAVDISSSLFPRKQIPNIRFTKLNLLKLNKKEKYDFVYCIDVLEHIRENRKVVVNIYRALKNGGYFYLHMPYNKYNKYILPSFIFKEFNKWAKREHIGKSYNLEELSNLLKEIGYAIIDGKYTFGFLGNLAWEIDRATDKLFLLKIIFSPILKILSYLSVKINYSKGDGVAIMAQKKKETHPLVSVILPTYNRASLLPRAIKSVLNQTYKNFELIIIDDDSTDNIKKIVNEFKDKRIKYIQHKENKGAAASRNTGIKLAKGEYIAFQDSDDEWLPEKLDKQIEVFESLSPQYAVVYSGFWYIRSGQKKYLPSSGILLKEGNIFKVLLNGNFITTQVVVCRKGCFKKVGLFDEKLPRLQDWELWIRISKKYLFKYINEPLTNVYHQSKDSISSNADALIKSTEMILEKHKEEIKKEKGLLSEYYFTIGNMFFAKNDFENGKRYFIKAKTLNPLTIRFLICAPIVIFAPRLYVKLLLLIRRSRGFKIYEIS